MKVLLARQSILDRDLEVLGYELLFRDPETGDGSISDPDSATSTVISNALLELGLETVAGSVPAFLRVTRQFLLWDNPILFEAEDVVFEIVDVDPDDTELLETVTRLAQIGYRFCGTVPADIDPDARLLQFLTYAKIELSDDSADLCGAVSAIQERGVSCIGLKVETQEQFASAMEAGFDAFQGSFLHHPEDVRGERLAESKIGVLQLMAQLHDPDVEIDPIKEIVSADPGLSHRILQIAGTAAYGVTKVTSIDQAIMRIGFRQLREWLTMLSLSTLDDRPSEILNVALLRAKMCEILKPDVEGVDAAELFTVGLLSLLDALMNAPMSDVLERLPLADEVTAAVLDQTGPAGAVLQAVKAYLAGEWDAVSSGGLSESDVFDAWLEGLSWVNRVRASLAPASASVA